MIHIKTTDRYNITTLRSFMTIIFSLLAGLVVISIIFLIAGANPIYAISEIFSGSFGSLYGIKETITKAIPLILIGTGLTLAFRAKFWNIGAEGQILMGAIFATWMGLTFGETLPSFIIVPLIFLAGFIGGASKFHQRRRGVSSRTQCPDHGMVTAWRRCADDWHGCRPRRACSSRKRQWCRQ